MATYDLPVVIPNNGTRVIAGPLDFLRLHASTGALRIIAEGRITTLVEGQSVSYKTPRDGVEIENLSDAQVTATFKVGFDAEITDSNLSGNVDVSKATTLSDASDAIVVQGAAAAQIVAAAATRRWVIIKALVTNNQTVRVGTNAIGAARGYPLEPGEVINWDVTAALYAWTAAGVNQKLSITEIAD